MKRESRQGSLIETCQAVVISSWLDSRAGLWPPCYKISSSPTQPLILTYLHQFSCHLLCPLLSSFTSLQRKMSGSRPQQLGCNKPLFWQGHKDLFNGCSIQMPAPVCSYQTSEKFLRRQLSGQVNYNQARTETERKTFNLNILPARLAAARLSRNRAHHQWPQPSPA